MRQADRDYHDEAMRQLHELFECLVLEYEEDEDKLCEILKQGAKDRRDKLRLMFS